MYIALLFRFSISSAGNIKNIVAWYQRLPNLTKKSYSMAVAFQKVGVSKNAVAAVGPIAELSIADRQVVACL
jgi:hypothetical protein